MAFTVTQDTTGVQGVADDLIYVVKDDPLTGTINFRYICSVRLDGAEVVQLKQLPNNSNCAVFNTRSIAANYVRQDDMPYSLGATGIDGSLDTAKIFSTNTEALKTFTFRFGYEFSATAADAPAETLKPSTDIEVTCLNATFVSPTASLPSSTAATDYKLTSSSRLFLSDITAERKGGAYPTSILYTAGGDTQRAALAFLNGDDVGSTGSDYLHVSYYNGASALNTGYFTNDTAQGGKAPAAGLTDAQSLLYVGVGTYNLEEQGIDVDMRPSAAGNADWTHYDIRMASSTTLSGNETSALYRFERVTCGKYVLDNQQYSLHWWNSKGGVDNLPVLGKVNESQQIAKQSYRTSGGNSLDADGSSTVFVKQPWQGGKRSTKVQTTTTYELSTIGGSPDQLTPLIRSLLNSERVFLSGTGVWGGNLNDDESGIVQAYVTDTQVTYLSSVNDKAISYKVKVEISRRRANP
jgi:hypothetical protein